MMNKISKAAHFVIMYGESASAYNERLMEFDPRELLEEGWMNEYIGLEKDDLPEVLDIFNEEFVVPENRYMYLEVKAIRKWIGEKFLA
jgi:hypothetical protein